MSYISNEEFSELVYSKYSSIKEIIRKYPNVTGMENDLARCLLEGSMYLGIISILMEESLNDEDIVKKLKALHMIADRVEGMRSMFITVAGNMEDSYRAQGN